MYILICSTILLFLDKQHKCTSYYDNLFGPKIIAQYDINKLFLHMLIFEKKELTNWPFYLKLT